MAAVGTMYRASTNGKDQTAQRGGCGMWVENQRGS